MGSHRVVLSLLVWLIWSVMAVEGRGNCTGAVSAELPRENTHYEFRGMSARIRPARNYQPVDGVGEITWSIRALVERNKTRYNVNGEELFPAQCSTPSGLYGFDPSFNPLQPYEPSTVCDGVFTAPCGPLLQHWSLDDFDCYAQSSESVINGVNISTILVRSWLAGSPDSFIMTASYQVADADLDITVPRTNRDQTIRYRKDVAKLGYTIENVPWLYNNSAPFPIYDNDLWAEISFLSLYFQLNMTSREMADINITDETYATKVALYTRDGQLTLDIHLDLITALDNRTSTTASPPNITRVSEGGKISSLTTAIPFCALNGGHWNMMDYDPSLVALFSGPLDEPPTPPSPGTKSGGLSHGAVAGIAVGVIALVVILVVAIIIFSVKSTTFKRIVRPFSSRKYAHVDAINPQTPPSSNGSTGWAPAIKPSD